MANNAVTSRVDVGSSLTDLNSYLSTLSMRGGWNKHEASLWSFPRTGFRAAAWRWREARAALEGADRLISTEDTERRNVLLVNPLKDNHYASLRTLSTHGT
jgi:gentisate 1,2-dioxygenase